MVLSVLGLRRYYVSMYVSVYVCVYADVFTRVSTNVSRYVSISLCDPLLVSLHSKKFMCLCRMDIPTL